jgi:hypothetical protein
MFVSDSVLFMFKDTAEGLVVAAGLVVVDAVEVVDVADQLVGRGPSLKVERVQMVRDKRKGQEREVEIDLNVEGKVPH